MYQVQIEEQFSSAHRLRHYRGRCEQLHGHNWSVRVVIEGETLADNGMLADFRVLRGTLRALLQGLDHHYLNNVPYFRRNNPTAENIARFLYQRLKKELPSSRCRLVLVEVSESPGCSASYRE